MMVECVGRWTLLFELNDLQHPSLYSAPESPYDTHTAVNSENHVLRKAHVSTQPAIFSTASCVPYTRSVFPNSCQKSEFHAGIISIGLRSRVSIGTQPFEPGQSISSCQAVSPMSGRSSSDDDASWSSRLRRSNMLGVWKRVLGAGLELAFCPFVFVRLPVEGFCLTATSSWGEDWPRCGEVCWESAVLKLLSESLSCCCWRPASTLAARRSKMVAVNRLSYPASWNRAWSWYFGCAGWVTMSGSGWLSSFSAISCRVGDAFKSPSA